MGVTERSIRRNIKQYSVCTVEGVGGNGGIKYKITLSSLPQAAQDRYHGIQEEKSLDIRLSLTDAQRSAVDHKEIVIYEYRKFKSTYPKADKLQAFLRQYNENNPDSQITKRQLNHWEKLYKRDGVAGLVDRRGGYNKGQSNIPKKAHDIFLAYWLQEKGTKDGGPSVASCYRYTQLALPDIDIPSISAFQRLAKSVDYPTKVYHREGVKAFNDKCMPYLPFDYRSIQSNDQWVADNHIFDVLVRFPDGSVGRPWVIGWTDRRSRYVVSHLVVKQTPNANDILEAFAQGIDICGIPNNILIDNGKDYTVKDMFNNQDFVYSIANQMSISVTNATPYNAKAKPIERFFRTLEESYCIHLSSYIGSNPKKRPERLKKPNAKLEAEAMPYNEFVTFIKNSIEVFNGTQHSGEGMAGKTPQQVYHENFIIPMKVVDPDVLDMYLKRTSTKPLKVGRNGIKVPELEQYYDSDDLFPYQGQKIYAKYSTSDVRRIRCYTTDNKFICIASSIELASLDQEITANNLRELNRKKKERRKAVREGKPGVEVYSMEQLITEQVEQNIPLQKPDLRLLPTMPTINSSHHKEAKAIKGAEQRQKVKDTITPTKTRSRREISEALFRQMT